MEEWGAFLLEGQEKQDILKELEELSEKKRVLEMVYALKFRCYRQSGGKKELMREPIFRTFNWIYEAQGFKGMSGQFCRQMCEKLSKGAFLPTQEHVDQMESSPEKIRAQEEIDQSRLENVDGSQMFRERTALHMDYLEQKYGYTIQTPEYYARHQDEVLADFSPMQVMNNMAINVPGFLDMKKPEDVRLRAQIEFYNEIAMVVTGMTSTYTGMGYSQEVRDTFVNANEKNRKKFENQLRNTPPFSTDVYKY